MISMSRVLTVVRKDVLWAMNNLKLLSVMLVPVFMVVFFSRLDAAATFGFSLTFVNSFVGLFSTSYLIIEEKNKGTLLALLTTPLTGAELLLGKFLFNLLLCLTFSVLAMALNNRLDILLNPLVFFNLVFFAGTTCFFGYTMGVFFRNEQEMSVLAPVLMILFVFGGAADKLAVKDNIHAFFPDYHMMQTTRDVAFELSDLLVHFGFNLLYFLIAFGMAAAYTNFYFSNNRERRFSKQLIATIFVFCGALVASGVYFNKYEKKESSLGDAKTLVGRNWTVSYQFDEKNYGMKPIIESKDKTVLLISHIKDSENNFTISYRKPKEDEKTLEARREKVESDENRMILARLDQEKDGQPVVRWVYSRKDRMIVLAESFCGDELLQWSIDVTFNKMTNFERHYTDFLNLEKSLKINCSL